MTVYDEDIICNEECKNGVKGCPYISCPKKKKIKTQVYNFKNAELK